MVAPPFDPRSLITIACPAQPPCGLLRPLAVPPGQRTDAYSTLWRFNALPSARRDVESTTSTKSVDTPKTERRNQADRVHGSIWVLSVLQARSLSRIWGSGAR